jgi:hypothetical protein
MSDTPPKVPSGSSPTGKKSGMETSSPSGKPQGSMAPMENREPKDAVRMERKPSGAAKASQGSVVRWITATRNRAVLLAIAVGTAILSAIAAAIITPDTLPRWWDRGTEFIDIAQFESRRFIASLIFPQTAKQTYPVDEKQALGSLEAYETARKRFTDPMSENMFLAHVAGEAVTWVGFVLDVGSEQYTALVLSTQPDYDVVLSDARERVICQMDKGEWNSARAMLGDHPVLAKVEFTGSLSVSKRYDLGSLEHCSLKRVLAH